jgi:hypothetical protein
MIVRLLAAFLLTLIAFCDVWCQEIGKVKNGQLDLRKWNSTAQPVISLGVLLERPAAFQRPEEKYQQDFCTAFNTLERAVDQWRAVA